MAERYKLTRADGWPLCPRCGKDELYSLENPATLENIFGCYACDFRMPPQRKELPPAPEPLMVSDQPMRDWTRWAWVNIKLAFRSLRRCRAALAHWERQQYYLAYYRIRKRREARRQARKEELLRQAALTSFIDVDAKCPACGHCQGEIRFSADHEVVIHTCKICGAHWGEKPIVTFNHWKVAFADQDDGLPPALRFLRGGQRTEPPDLPIPSSAEVRPNGNAAATKPAER